MTDREAAIRYLRRMAQQEQWLRLDECADVLEAELAAAREREAKLREALREAYTFLEGNYDGDARELASRIATLLRADGEGET